MSAKPPTADLMQPRRPRGRPKIEDLAALEARLKLVGRELFFRDGYGATSMSEVARAARASKTTLYSRFDSKAALLRAIVAEQIASWDDSGAQNVPLAHLDSLAETLEAYGAIVLRAGLSDEFVQLNRLLYAESGRFPELAEIADARFKLGVRYLADQIRKFAELDRIDCRDAEAAAELFLTMIVGWTSVVVLGNRVVAPEAQAAWLHNCVRTFMASRADW
jgi:TetR/AcrR family transcriptional regulator, mexJK operon transcriptional repressor